MRKLVLFTHLVFLLLATEMLHAQVASVDDGSGTSTNSKGEKVTVITITDTNLIPKNIKIQRAANANTGIDSSRFITKNIKDSRKEQVVIKGIRVDKTIFGKHQDFIESYVKNYHANFGERISRIQRQHKAHFSFVDNVFKKYGIPKEVKALAIIESAMKFNALSSVGAKGPWQFMPETGRLLGLRVDDKVDERIDFYKSTKAAAVYLKKLSEMFDNDWLLVIAAYNWGPGNITRQINKGKGKSFWDIKDNLPKETRNHVMAFIATSCYMDNKYDPLSLGNYPKEAKAPRPNFGSLAGNFNNINSSISDNDTSSVKPNIAPQEMDNIAILKVKGAYCIPVISKILDFDIQTLNRWNPNFDQTIVKSEVPIYLRIPLNKLDEFILKKEKIIFESRKVLLAQPAK